MIEISTFQLKRLDDTFWDQTQDWVLEQVGPPDADVRRADIAAAVDLARESKFEDRADVLALVRYTLACELPTDNPVISDQRLPPAQRVEILNDFDRQGLRP